MPENRKIIHIDEDKCDGCGLCIPTCAEGALQIINGKARLVEDKFCDGLGDCLGECPAGAIQIIEREAEPFDEEAVERHLLSLKKAENEVKDSRRVCAGSCPGVMETEWKGGEGMNREEREGDEPEPELEHWPIQLSLVSPQSRFLQGRDLLIAADCVPFAFADFHYRFLRGRSLLIGCPKLDDREAYKKKLTEIFNDGSINNVTIAYMEVPCCHGLSALVQSALKESGKEIPVEEIVIGVDGVIK